MQLSHRQGLLAEQYVGDPPAGRPIAEDVVEVAERIVTAVADHCRAAADEPPM